MPDSARNKALENRERMLICPAPGTSHDAIEGLLAKDFREVGASGRIYTRTDAIVALLSRTINHPAEDWALSGFSVRSLSAEVCLTTYTLSDWTGRKSRRATLWQQNGGLWQAVYHQGTTTGGDE